MTEFFVQWAPVTSAWMLIWGDRKQPVETWQVLNIFSLKADAEWELKRITRAD